LKSSPNAHVNVIKGTEPGPELAIVESGGSARAVIWPGSGAEHRSMNLIFLEPNGQTIELRHPSESVYHVTEGDGTMVDHEAVTRHDVVTGSMLFIDAGTTYSFKAGPSGALLLGGPCPPDPDLYPPKES
jgi:quercetin dioxygenase-like cupin family protein